eukprot:895831_1
MSEGHQLLHQPQPPVIPDVMRSRIHNMQPLPEIPDTFAHNLSHDNMQPVPELPATFAQNVPHEPEQPGILNNNVSQSIETPTTCKPNFLHESVRPRIHQNVPQPSTASLPGIPGEPAHSSTPIQSVIPNLPSESVQRIGSPNKILQLIDRSTLSVPRCETPPPPPPPPPPLTEDLLESYLEASLMEENAVKPRRNSVSGYSDEEVVAYIRARTLLEHVSVQSVRDRLHIGYKRAKRLCDFVYLKHLKILPKARSQFMRSFSQFQPKICVPPAMIKQYGGDSGHRFNSAGKCTYIAGTTVVRTPPIGRPRSRTLSGQPGMYNHGQPGIHSGHPTMASSQPVMSSCQSAMSNGQPAMPSGQHVMSSGQPGIYSGQHTMSSGQHTMPTGQPAMSNGRHILSSGQPTMLSDQPAMLCRQPTTLTGHSTMPSGHSTIPVGQPAVPSVQPTVSSGDHAMSNGQSAIVHRGQPTISGGYPTTPNGQHVMSSGQPTMPSGQPRMLSRQPTLPSVHSTMPSGQPAIPSGRPVMSRGHPTLSRDHKSAIHSGQPTIYSNPSMSSGQPAMSSDRPTVFSVHPTMSSGQPTMSSGQPGIDTDQHAISSGHPTTSIHSGRPTNSGQRTTHSGQSTIHSGQFNTHSGQPTIHNGQPTIHSGQPKIHPTVPSDLRTNGTYYIHGVSQATNVVGRPDHSIVGQSVQSVNKPFGLTGGQSIQFVGRPIGLTEVPPTRSVGSSCGQQIATVGQLCNPIIGLPSPNTVNRPVGIANHMSSQSSTDPVRFPGGQPALDSSRQPVGFSSGQAVCSSGDFPDQMPSNAVPPPPAYTDNSLPSGPRPSENMLFNSSSNIAQSSVIDPQLPSGLNIGPVSQKQQQTRKTSLLKSLSGYNAACLASSLAKSYSTKSCDMFVEFCRKDGWALAPGIVQRADSDFLKCADVSYAPTLIQKFIREKLSQNLAVKVSQFFQLWARWMLQQNDISPQVFRTIMQVSLKNLVNFDGNMFSNLLAKEAEQNKSKLQATGITLDESFDGYFVIDTVAPEALVLRQWMPDSESRIRVRVSSVLSTQALPGWVVFLVIGRPLSSGDYVVTGSGRVIEEAGW